MKGNSRIIVTTRLENLADDLSSDKFIYEKDFLGNNGSWDLLRGMIFAPGEHCPYELQKFGKKIAENCQGLPLAILVVGQHLRTAEKTVEYWKEVSEAENLHDITEDGYQNISASLLLSYRMLPRHLKECFLYIGTLPNYEISVKKLYMLWVAEGFYRRPMRLDLEDEGRTYIHELVCHCVVLSSEASFRSYRLKACRIHFVFRYLCVHEAKNEKFCLVIKKYADSFLQGSNRMQRLSIHNSVVLGIKQAQDNLESISDVRSFLCIGPQPRHVLQVSLNFRLLKVLNALSIRFYEFPLQVLKLVHLRYLAITYHGKIPESISQLWNLVVFIVGRPKCIVSPHARARLPLEIWNLTWLRHLQCTGKELVDPGADNNHQGTLEQLVTLLDVGSQSCSQGILARVPNITKLGVRIELAPGEVETFSFLDDVATQLHKLNTFKCVVLGLNSPPVISSCVKFPDTLTKLTLSGCRFPWSYMSTIGRLPALEVLKLQCYAFCGPVWETDSDNFIHLHALLLEDLDIEEWRTTSNHFPNLWKLKIRHCYKLQKIPLEMKLTEAENITLEDCSPSFMSSAKEIWRNPDTYIHTKSSWKDEKKHKSQSN